MSEQLKVLVTGATGYIGGRLIKPLLNEGHNVRVMSRNKSHLQGRSWLNNVEVGEGDVLDTSSLAPILENIDVAYYLIHSMAGTDKFADRDQQAAENFARAATDAGVKQIIYLGGLGEQSDDLSEHLQSRQQVGDTLRKYHNQVTEFRAAMVIGAGSLSFEITRNLTERLPIMIAPKWLYTRSQPIAIRDILLYLTAAINRPTVFDKIIEIGGTDIRTYHDMLLDYANARDLKRYIIPVPVLTPHLSSYWVHLVTPVSADITRPLILGLKNETVVTDDSATDLFPDIQPIDFETALHEALSELDAQQVETSWTDSMSATWEADEPYKFTEERGMLIERRVRQVDASPTDVYRAFTSLGGETGWLHLNALWQLRGWLDRFVGGPGYRRGRPARAALRIGDAVDFWRIEAIEPDKSLLLRAEMKLPGKGWLHFEVKPMDNGQSQLIQTAYYAPKGLFGYVYWYAIYILHKSIFDGMIDKVKSLAESISSHVDEEAHSMA